ncbi:hypothetical protein SLA2020_052500 [Shorea laevis]
MMSLFLCFLLIANVSELKAAQEKCQTTRCKHRTIRFPFRLKGLQPDLCGYPGGCLSLQLPNLNLSASPFQFTTNYTQKYTIFNCSREANVGVDYLYDHEYFGGYYGGEIPCLNSPEFQVIAIPSDSTSPPGFVNCSITLLNISKKEVYRDMLYYLTGDVHFSWSQPNCSECEAVGRKCKLKIDNRQNETECYGTTKKQTVLNNFLATGEEFINEVGSMCRIHHVNVTRLIGFCADGNKRALVYEYMPNESLEKFLFVAKDEDHHLGWEKLQDIAMGIARGIEYLHQGGRKNIDAMVESTSQVYFPEWVYNCLDRGEELRIRIENEGHAKIARKLTIVGLWCIQWYPADRPSMKAVTHMLEGEVDNFTVPPNPFEFFLVS